MPKKTAHPRLRTHIRKGEHGQVWTSWSYDMRPDGESDISLGNDYAEAIKKWEELYHNKPRIAGTLQEAFERWRKEVLLTYESDETRKGYARSLKNLEPVLGPATWDQVTAKTITGYLKKRTAKTQGNREMALLSVIWAWAMTEDMVFRPFPLLGVRGWKNKETPRTFEVTDALFAAVYGEADQTLRNAMDLASATGLRLTDCRTVLLPTRDGLPIKANKTGKSATFDVEVSPVLSRLVSARRAQSFSTLLLLTTSTGRQLSARMLRDLWDEARAKAAAKPENGAIADELRAMYLRDMRKRASDLAGSDQEASELLQHSSVALTKKHYRSKPTKLRPVR